MGGWTKPWPSFKRTLDINPKHAEAHYNLGNALFQKGRVDEAMAQFKEALEIKPNYAEAHHNLGNIFFSKAKRDKWTTQLPSTVRPWKSIPTMPKPAAIWVSLSF